MTDKAGETVGVYVTPEMVEEGISVLAPLFRAWGDPDARDTGDSEIDGATSSAEMAGHAVRRLVDLWSCMSSTPPKP